MGTYNHESETYREEVHNNLVNLSNPTMNAKDHIQYWVVVGKPFQGFFFGCKREEQPAKPSVCELTNLLGADACLNPLGKQPLTSFPWKTWLLWFLWGFMVEYSLSCANRGPTMVLGALDGIGLLAIELPNQEVNTRR